MGDCPHQWQGRTIWEIAHIGSRVEQCGQLPTLTERLSNVGDHPHQLQGRTIWEIAHIDSRVELYGRLPTLTESVEQYWILSTLIGWLRDMVNIPFIRRWHIY